MFVVRACFQLSRSARVLPKDTATTQAHRACLFLYRRAQVSRMQPCCRMRVARNALNLNVSVREKQTGDCTVPMGLRRKKWRMRAIGLIAVLLTIAAMSRADVKVHTNQMNFDPQVREAYHYFYLLDYQAAVQRFERIHQEHPGDPHATAMLLNAVVFQDLYRQDLLDTTFYANDGFLTGKHATDEDPKKRDEIFALADEAVREADSRLSKNSTDVDALFARGWARSLRCTYVAMVERGFGAGFRLAGKAKDDCARVLQLDPQYVDAKLVVGVYEYVVGALPFPFKILIGFVGITGSKSKGMELLRDDAERGVATSVEARTVIALFLRRESKYKEAIEVVRSLKRQYPHDYLFCLEDANLRKDAGEGMAAAEAYREIIADSAKRGYFAEARLELAYFGLGDALRGQRHYEEAARAYEQAAAANGAGTELKVRTLLAAGECHDLLGERQNAIRDYQAAIAAGPNTSRADTARKRLKSPYKAG
jgi:tetratricopeptide (TPR) repeat protein